MGIEIIQKMKYKQFGAIMIIAMLIPLFVPFLLPIRLSQMTLDFIKVIESLPAGSIVVWGEHRLEPGDQMSGRDWYVNLLEYLCERRLKILFLPFSEYVPPGLEYVVDRAKIVSKYNYVYGTDWVLFPFIPGDESALAAIAADMQGTVATDRYGNKIADLPMMKGIKTIADANVALIIWSSFTWADMYVRQWSVKYGIKTLNVARYTPIGQYYGVYVQGCLDGDRGQAELQYYRHFAGEQILKMDSANIQLMVWFIVLIWAFLSFQLVERRKLAARGGKQ